MARLEWDAHQLQQQIANLYRLYPDLLGDDEMLKVDTLEGATNLHELATVIVVAIAKAVALAEGAANEQRDIKTRKARYEMREAFLREMLMKILQAADIKKLELPKATIGQHRGQPQIVGEPDVNALPDEFVRIKREPDRVAIREALMSGRDVPGLTLSNAPPTLVINPK